MPPRRAISVLVCAGVLWLAPAAHATDYCVAPNTSCGGTNVATFEAALDAADDADGPNRIFLGAATYTAPTATGYVYNRPTGQVEIAGAGRGQTILTAPIGGSPTALALYSALGSSVHDLTVRLPQNAAAGYVGVLATGDLRRLDVIETVTQSNGRFGVVLKGGSLEDSTVTLADTPNSFGMLAQVSGAAVRGSTIQANNPLRFEHGGTVEHSVFRGAGSGMLLEGDTTITDSLIAVTDPFGRAITGFASSGLDGTTNTDGVTLIGPGTADSVAVGTTNEPYDTQKATVNIVDTLIRGFGHALRTDGSSPGEANVHAAYSDYDPSGNVDNGTGAITETNVTNLGDARFVDPAAGDYRLRGDSPLVDIGEPGTPATLTDLAGLPRLVGARRDVGAYEYQARPPVAAIAGPATAQTGQQVSFSGAGSSDPDGDPLGYAWTVDGTAAGSGPTLLTTFATPGSHTVALTVTDPGGRQSSTSQAVTVTGAPVDTTAPVISKLQARPARVRRGRPVTFRFGLSEAADTQLKILRVLPGRREGRACRKPTKRNRKARRCTRRVLVRTFKGKGSAGANRMRFSGKVRGHALLKGRYEAVLSATDAAGNRSVPRRISFRVI